MKGPNINPTHPTAPQTPLLHCATFESVNEFVLNYYDASLFAIALLPVVSPSVVRLFGNLVGLAPKVSESLIYSLQHANEANGLLSSRGIPNLWTRHVA